MVQCMQHNTIKLSLLDPGSVWKDVDPAQGEELRSDLADLLSLTLRVNLRHRLSTGALDGTRDERHVLDMNSSKHAR